jgi:Ca2+-binding EF-hand superfamily protein
VCVFAAGQSLEPNTGKAHLPPLPDVRPALSQATSMMSSSLNLTGGFKKPKVGPEMKSRSVKSSKSIKRRAGWMSTLGIGGDEDSSGGNLTTRGLTSKPSAGPGMPKINRDSRFFSKRGRHVLQPTNSWSTGDKKQFGEDIVRIFWFNSANLYFEIVMLQVMIISCYLSLWISNYGPVGWGMPSHRTFWIVIGGLPGLLSVVLNLYTVRCAALLKAVSALDKDIVEEVLEQTEASKNLSISLRDKILSRLNNTDEPEKEIKELFEDIDENGSGSLRYISYENISTVVSRVFSVFIFSRAEFQVFLHDLDITFSRRRWDQIFKEIDKNFDDEISLEELFLFIFPNHDNARVRYF